ncbi:MAG: SsrA-binding protein SmpB [Planctomycetes bacterium]|nr:SsrA-binding protein SmpB [Planctomycetota bacterium]NOG55757.1 SsrA-binding protein SmpB [Planctomycetota bacterium]
MARSGKNKSKSPAGNKAPSGPEIHNRKARKQYLILDTIECGIALIGSEVKAVRDGRISLGEGFARVDEKSGELWLHNIHISEYGPARGSINAHDPTRKRKLLAHSREIRKLADLTRAKGTTLVPLKLYFKHGWAKLLLGVGQGKRKADVRESEKKRDAERSIQRAMTRKRI